VTEQDLEVRKAVKHAGKREPQELHAGLVMPADAVGGERVVDGIIKARVQRRPDPRLRDLRVDVQWGAQRRRSLEDRPVVGMVEVALTGAAEQQRTVEAELGDRALKLLRGGGRRGGGKGREALKPVRVGVYELGDAVVGLDLQAGGLLGRKVMQPWRSRSPTSPAGALARESSRARESTRLHAVTTSSLTKCSSVPIVFISVLPPVDAIVFIASSRRTGSQAISTHIPTAATALAADDVDPGAQLKRSRPTATAAATGHGLANAIARRAAAANQKRLSRGRKRRTASARATGSSLRSAPSDSGLNGWLAP
jgi:hypothetical protein